MSETLKVIVHYAAARKPYEEEHAHRSETISTLKVRVLKAFGLTEGQPVDGKTYTYTLYDDNKALENPSETLGQLIGHNGNPEPEHEHRHEHEHEHGHEHGHEHEREHKQHVLKLKLSQQVTQG